MTSMIFLMISGLIFILTTAYDFVVRLALLYFRSDISPRDIYIYPHETVFLFRNAWARNFHALIAVINYCTGALSAPLLIYILIKQSLLQ